MSIDFGRYDQSRNYESIKYAFELTEKESKELFDVLVCLKDKFGVKELINILNSWR